MAISVAAVLCVGAACGGNEPGPKPASNHVVDTTGMAQNLSQLNDPELMKLKPVLINQIRNSGSEYQKDLVADGSLTLAEYEKAELAYAACMEAAGFQVQPKSTQLNGMARINVQVGPFTDRAAEGQAEGTCRGTYTSAIDLPWADLTVAISQEIVAESRHFMATCVEGKGLKVADRPGDSDDPAVVAKYFACMSQMMAKYNIDIGFGVEGDENYRG
jgi:hypothetical protein